ncbi:unnamed protein product [Pylaiella littoralis]
MTSMKRPVEEISQDLSKTERRRRAKRAKKERLGKGGGGGTGTPGRGGAAETLGRTEKKGPKPKMTKEERRAKYTQKAYEARDKQNQLGPGANKTRCLGCRTWGHIVANCPEAKTATGICFNCGSSKHALRVCPKPKQRDGSLPHATCFVCKGKGHISAHCKQNANGIYPKGGFCKGCGSKHHLSWDCPDSTKVDRNKLNNNAASSSSSSEAGDANPDQRGEKGEDRETAPDEPRGRRGKGVTTDGGAATTGGVGDGGGVVVEESQAKRRKSGNPGASQTRGSKKAPAPPRFGGDDLEDDGYYDPEDVPDAHFEADHGMEDQFGSKGGAVAGKAGGAGTTASAKSKKKNSKVVVF